MADEKKRQPDDRESRSGAEDQLSPSRALKKSVGQGSQRVGNNEPLANPIVSFPEGGEDTSPKREDASREDASPKRSADDGEC
jgi:hypothetical protein